MALKWYAVQTYSGCENKVYDTLKNISKTKTMEGKIEDILIPTEEIAEIKDGKKKISTKKMFPGYVFIKMDIDEDSWEIVKSTPGVSKFVGTKNQAVPLTDREVEDMLRRMTESEEAPRPKIQFSEGERVKVVEGPFYNFSGVVSSINEERGRLTVMVDILGRQTPVELDFLQVEKM